MAKGMPITLSRAGHHTGQVHAGTIHTCRTDKNGSAAQEQEELLKSKKRRDNMKNGIYFAQSGVHR